MRNQVLYGKAYKDTQVSQRIICGLFLVNVPIWVWAFSRLTF